MHEMALVRNVVDIVVEEASKSGGERVSAVYLTIGYGRDIIEEYFDGLFARMTKDTIAEGCDLIVRRTPIMARCNHCDYVFALDVFDQETWVCPSCKTIKDYKLQSGMEFLINHIEVVDDRIKMPA